MNMNQLQPMIPACVIQSHYQQKLSFLEGQLQELRRDYQNLKTINLTLEQTLRNVIDADQFASGSSSLLMKANATPLNTHSSGSSAEWKKRYQSELKKSYALQQYIRQIERHQQQQQKAKLNILYHKESVKSNDNLIHHQNFLQQKFQHYNHHSHNSPPVQSQSISESHFILSPKNLNHHQKAPRRSNSSKVGEWLSHSTTPIKEQSVLSSNRRVQSNSLRKRSNSVEKMDKFLCDIQRTSNQNQPKLKATRGSNCSSSAKNRQFRLQNENLDQMFVNLKLNGNSSQQRQKDQQRKKIIQQYAENGVNSFNFFKKNASSKKLIRTTSIRR